MTQAIERSHTRLASCLDGMNRLFGSGAALNGMISVMLVKYSIVG